MAAQNLVVENFDQVDDSALNELGNRYQHNECWDEEEEYLRKGAIEKLPDDYEFEVNAFCATSKSTFRICVSHTDLKIDNMKGWLIDFQSIINVTVKIEAKGKQTKGYLLQTYYGCQHNTRNWSLSKDPQRKLSLNPTVRIKIQIAHFRW